ncbi:hypothetical protein PIB30_029854 [Stylosanthes scabra]|uniref:Ubiquitin-like protease family profile domain-containing protein n=1 Tax=Stylosanthes scabra TaxID=79078 RepID=A0ABU6YA68_9FABA|nr:hypothetical protein [Stylosanthes scabra]
MSSSTVLTSMTTPFTQLQERWKSQPRRLGMLLVSLPQSNILDQLRIWAGAPSIFDEGSCSLLPRYVNIPGQPNETDCGVFVMKWMELIDPTGLAASCEANKGYNIDKWAEPKLEEFKKQIVAKIMLSKNNEKRIETIRLLNEMRNIRPAAVLRSPYVQVSSADLYTK